MQASGIDACRGSSGGTYGGVVRKLMLIAGVLLMAAVSASAIPIEVTLLNYGPGGVWENGYPYFGLVPGVGDTPIMCDDYVHGGNPGDKWFANITNMGTLPTTSVNFV